MTLVYNAAGLVVGVVAAAAALLCEAIIGFGETDGSASLLVGFGVMTALGTAAELRLSSGKRPRYFWFFPAWTVGLAGIGGALHVFVDRPAGMAVLCAAGLGFCIHVLLETRGPGGKWVAGMGLSALGLLVESLLEEWLVEGKPWWGMAIRGALIVAFLYATARAWWARRSARAAAGAAAE